MLYGDENRPGNQVAKYEVIPSLAHVKAAWGLGMLCPCSPCGKTHRCVCGDRWLATEIFPLLMEEQYSSLKSMTLMMWSRNRLTYSSQSSSVTHREIFNCRSERFANTSSGGSIITMLAHLEFHTVVKLRAIRHPT